MSLTKPGYERLVESVLAAEGSGSCLYADGDKPRCVIGQFAYRCGVSMETLKLWDGPGGGFAWMMETHPILHPLQGIWDKGVDLFEPHKEEPRLHDEDDRRLAMLFEIEAAR